MTDLFTEPSGIQELVTSTSTIEEFEAKLKLEKEAKKKAESEIEHSDDSKTESKKPLTQEQINSVSWKFITIDCSGFTFNISVLVISH